MKSKPSKTLQERSRRDQLFANASLLYSMLALERGIPQLALIHAKQNVRLLRHAWAGIEEISRVKQTSTSTRPQMAIEKLGEEVSQLSASTSTIIVPEAR